MQCTVLIIISITCFKCNGVETLKALENGVDISKATTITERPTELEKFHISENQKAVLKTEGLEPKKNHVPENKEANKASPPEPEKNLSSENKVETVQEATKEKPPEPEKNHIPENKVETVKDAATERTSKPTIDCVEKKCIAKCCPNGLHVAKTRDAVGKVCAKLKKRHNNLTLNAPLYDVFQKRTGKHLLDVYNLVPGRLIDGNFTTKAYDFRPVGHEYYLTENGILYEEAPNELKRWHTVNPENYCVDFYLRRNYNPELRFWTIISAYTSPPDDPFLTAAGIICLLISCVFLLAVLVVYLLLPELRNLNGLVQMAYVVSLLGAFLLSAVLQMMEHSSFTCLGLTYFTYFFFLATFCWINVMSWDINSTFSRSQSNHRWRHSHWSKFNMYCAYAFGLPSAMTIMLIVLNHTDMRHLPWFVTPNLIKFGCFLGDEAKLLYLSIPMLILTLFNFAMYLMTCNHLCQQYKKTDILDSARASSAAPHRTRRQKILIFVRLFSIMGLPWTLEVISSFFPGEYMWWYISDLFNILVGLFVFLITVGTQKNTRDKLIKRLQRLVEWSHSLFSRSRNTRKTTETDVSQETPLRRPSVCGNPSGPS